MADNSEKSFKKFECKKRGCDAKFQHKTQLYCHRTICNGTTPKKEKKFVFENDVYQCIACCYTDKYRSNIYRHIKICRLSEQERKRDISASSGSRHFTINHI